MRRNVISAIVLATVMLLFTSVQAADFDFSGTFTKDNDVALLNFSVGAFSTVTIFSSSWGVPNGNADGYILYGGFDPILAIWTSAGALQGEQDDGGIVGTTTSNGVDYFHGYWDSYYSLDLNAGDYLASITQFNNFANGNQLSNGFNQDSNPTFTQGFATVPQTYFNGVYLGDNDYRTGDWEFHLINVSAANVQSIPEPGTILLVGSGLLGLAGARRRRRHSGAIAELA